jgi:uncharacterized membrane protein YfcA
VEILGYIGALFIGTTLGLIGGGGSILTVPVFVYLLSIEPVPATAYSLFVVGLTALVGSIAFMKKGLVSYRTAVVFAIPAFIAVFATRKFIVPAIPTDIFTIDSFIFSKDLFVMLLFAALMIAASVSMIKNKKKETENVKELEFNYPLIIIEGIVVGILTGLVGAGGGFLIVPALVLLAKLPMKMAVGTSLLIIAVKSLFGFAGDIGNMPIDWQLLAIFSAIAIAGILIGSYLSKYVPGEKLKPAFGWFTLAMGIFIITKEIWY